MTASRLRVGDANERASAVTARPVQYRRFDRLLVSADDRAERHHDGSYLVLLFADLAHIVDCRRRSFARHE